MEYHPGSLNPADYLSRHPHAATPEEEAEAEDTEEYIRYMMAQSSPLPLSMEVLREETHHDECLQRVGMPSHRRPEG